MLDRKSTTKYIFYSIRTHRFGIHHFYIRNGAFTLFLLAHWHTLLSHFINMRAFIFRCRSHVRNIFIVFDIFYKYNISINLKHFVENQVFSLETAFNAIFFYKSHFWKPTLKSYFLFSKSGFLSGFLRSGFSQNPT